VQALSRWCFTQNDAAATMNGYQGINMTWLQITISLTMVLNIVWFGMAFHYFSLKSEAAAKMLTPKPLRDLPLFETVAFSVKFLGGMNFAVACLSLLCLINPAGFNYLQLAWLAVVIAIVHAGQFIFNVPIALGKKNMPASDTSGFNAPMRLIFVVDGSLMVLNAVLAAFLFSH
jgi:hypothetical protein